MNPIETAHQLIPSPIPRQASEADGTSLLHWAAMRDDARRSKAQDITSSRPKLFFFCLNKNRNKQTGKGLFDEGLVSQDFFFNEALARSKSQV